MVGGSVATCTQDRADNMEWRHKNKILYTYFTDLVILITGPCGSVPNAEKPTLPLFCV